MGVSDKFYFCIDACRCNCAWYMRSLAERLTVGLRVIGVATAELTDEMELDLASCIAGEGFISGAGPV